MIFFLMQVKFKVSYASETHTVDFKDLLYKKIKEKYDNSFYLVITSKGSLKQQ